MSDINRMLQSQLQTALANFAGRFSQVGKSPE
jgi:hypothetical protein